MLAKYQTFLNKTQNSILSAAFVLALASGINAILGFVKGRVLVTFFSDSADLAIFYTADRIPDLIYSVIVVGALSTVFIPVFTSIYRKDKEKAQQTASSMINISLFLFFLAGSVIFIFASPIIKGLSLGKFDTSQVTLGANLMRIMLLAQLLLVGSSFLTSILQSFKYFLVPALAPIAYNLGFILGTYLLAPTFGIYGPALGVVIGALLHFWIQIPLFRKLKFEFTFDYKIKQNGAREMFKLMPPRIGSVLINNLITTINNSLAILISPSAVVHLKFANQLQFFPVSLFGYSIAHASLPTLAEESDDENLGKFKRTFITSFHQMMYLVMPISMILFVLRVPVVRIVYGAATFPWEATIKTSYALGFFAISIFAQSGVYLITRAFYALKDTKTPVKISAVTILVNVLLSVLFVNYFKLGVWSVAFAFSICALLNFVVMYFYLDKKTGGIDKVEILKPFVKISSAALFMGLALYVPMKLLDNFVFDTSRALPLIFLTMITGVIGMLVYVALTALLKVEEVSLLYRVIKKFRFSGAAQSLSEQANL